MTGKQISGQPTCKEEKKWSGKTAGLFVVHLISYQASMCRCLFLLNLFFTSRKQGAVAADAKQIRLQAAAGSPTSKVTSQHGESLSSMEMNEVSVAVILKKQK